MPLRPFLIFLFVATFPLPLSLPSLSHRCILLHLCLIAIVSRLYPQPRLSHPWMTTSFLEPSTSTQSCQHAVLPLIQIPGDKQNSLINNPLNPVTPHLQRLHPRPIREPHKVMTRTIKQIPPLGRVQVEENARHDNHLLLETGLEEVEPVGDGRRQALEVEPQVKGRVGDLPDDEAHVAQPLDYVIALVAEVVLQGDHFLLDEGRLEHGDGGFLEGDVGSAVEVGAAGANAVGC